VSAEAGSAITGAAFTGSHTAGDDDRCSDTDLVLAVRGELSPVLNRRTPRLYDDELGGLHHTDAELDAQMPNSLLSHTRGTGAGTSGGHDWQLRNCNSSPQPSTGCG
jgi:hypothetical protein